MVVIGTPPSCSASCEVITAQHRTCERFPVSTRLDIQGAEHWVRSGPGENSPHVMHRDTRQAAYLEHLEPIRKCEANVCALLASDLFAFLLEQLEMDAGGQWQIARLHESSCFQIRGG